MKKQTISSLRLVPSVHTQKRGFVVVGGVAFPCAFGRSGFKRDKREGDGATPLHALALRGVFYRSDRLTRPASRLPVRAIKADDMWCDDVKSPNYNRLAKRGVTHSDEFLMRADNLYDIVIILGWNDNPVQSKRGSAIFWHGARDGFTPTAGCVATRLTSLKQLLPRLSIKTRLIPFSLAPRKGSYRP